MKVDYEQAVGVQTGNPLKPLKQRSAAMYRESKQQTVLYPHIPRRYICTNLDGSYKCSCPLDDVCETKTFDLYYILDSSSSVGQTNFNLMMDYVLETSKQFQIGQQDVRVRKTLFSTIE